MGFFLKVAELTVTYANKWGSGGFILNVESRLANIIISSLHIHTISSLVIPSKNSRKSSIN